MILFTSAVCLYVFTYIENLDLTNWWILISMFFQTSEEKLQKLKSVYCKLRRILNSSFSLSYSQEVILKRAADLVEALYGLPHNNQVRNTHTHSHKHSHGKRKKKNESNKIR